MTKTRTSLTYAKCRNVMVDGLNPFFVEDRRRLVDDGRMECLPIVANRKSRMPLLHPNLHLLDRRTVLSAAAVLLEARALAHIQWWALAHMPDSFEKNLSGGELIDIRRVKYSLIPWLRYSSINSRRKTQVLFVSNKTFNFRLIVLSQYIEMRFNAFILDGVRNLEEMERCKMKHSALQKIVHKSMISEGDAEERRALTEDEMQRIFMAIEPGAEKNPWRGLLCQIRNKLIVYILYATGIRRGELLNLWVLDVVIHDGGAFLRILKRPDDAVDPRKKQPVVKTLPRAIPVSQEIYGLLEYYIKHVRSLTPISCEHPFLFVNTREGEPLSADVVNDIIGQLSMIVGRRVFPHLLRHTFTTDLMAEAKKEGWREKEINRKLMQANGWRSEDSVRGYTVRATEEARFQTTKSHQNAIFKK